MLVLESGLQNNVILFLIIILGFAYSPSVSFHFIESEWKGKLRYV